MPKSRSAILRRLALLELAQQLGMRLERPLDRGERGFHVAHHRAEIAPGDVGADVEATSQLFVRDGIRRALDDDPGNLAQRHVLASRRLDRELLDGREVASRLRSAPDANVEDPTGVVRVRDLLARDHRRRGPTHVARLQSIPVRRLEVDLDVDLRNLDEQLDVEVDDALDPGHRLLELMRLLAQHVEVWPEDADDDRVARPGQHFTDALLQIRLHVATQARIALDHLLDGSSVAS